MKLKNKWWALGLIVPFLMTQHSWAYLDPNSGSIVLQLIIGGLAGLAVFFKLFWRKIKSFFMKDKK